jgi:hypothetical protein
LQAEEVEHVEVAVAVRVERGLSQPAEHGRRGRAVFVVVRKRLEDAEVYHVYPVHHVHHVYHVYHVYRPVAVAVVMEDALR